MGKRDADSTAVNRRGSLSPSSNALTSNTRYPCVSVTRLSSVMNFCFGLVVIFLILDVASVRSTGRKNSRLFQVLLIARVISCGYLEALYCGCHLWIL